MNKKLRMTKRLRIILYIPPWGFSSGGAIDVFFTDKKSYVARSSNPLYHLTQGEGQALQFILEDVDTSPKFWEAIRDGDFLRAVTDDKLGHFEMRYIPKGKQLKLIEVEDE